MMTRPRFLPRTGLPARVALLVVIAWGALAGGRSTWGAEPAAPTPGRTSGVGGETNGVIPRLPVVARPPALQPRVGLEADSHLDKTPPRATKGLDLVKAGWAYNCMECHKLFPARWHYEDRPFNEHKEILLEHGNNRFCLNCHHPVNRSAFVDYDGSEIAESDVVLLCAKCHGTIHRDWKAGVHGRQNGFWNAGLGEKTRLRCIQCHDPHSPRFKPLHPLAPLRYPPRAANPPPAGAPSHEAPGPTPLTHPKP